ncbi:ankyrin [Glonium stellatum]|uniref:Ankyrin n=1 Tax=Glonium stellatum TaxID=574774 RepID=A0A8E2EZG1_9PEZI|nr:ankyrin [Glonium stellatum]
MLPKFAPEAKIISVGFEIRNRTDAPFNFETAAAQLSEYLATARNGLLTRPILFIGHACGGIIIKLFTGLYGLQPNAKFFADLSTSSRKLSELTNNFKTKIIQKCSRPRTELRIQKRSLSLIDPPRLSGFPIIQFITSDERVSQQNNERAAEKQKLDHATNCLEDPESVTAAHIRQLRNAVTGDPENIQSLITDSGVNVHLRDQWGQTPLHLAIQRVNDPQPMLRMLLLTLPANPSIRDKQLNTPLHYVVARNNIFIVKLLLDAKADVNVENDSFETPISMAKQHKCARKMAQIFLN